MAKYSEEFKEEVKIAYINGSDSLAIVAGRFGIGERTIEMWSKDGGWEALKRANNVVPIGEAKSKQAKPINSQPAPVRVRTRRAEIDELDIVEGAIESLSGLLTGMTLGGEDRPIDTRGVGGVAGALVKLLEYRRARLKPATAAEVAEMAIGLGISPQEFIAELKVKWAQRA